MPRTNKESQTLNCRIDKEIAEKLEKFIQETRLSKTATVEKALCVFIEQYYKTGKI